MSNHHRVAERLAVAGAIFTGALALFGVGCSGQGPSGEEQSTPGAEASEASSAKLLAEVKMSDGTEYSFLQTTTGDLAIGVGANHALDLSDTLSRTPSLSALYEKLSGRAAPDALRLADKQLAAKGATTEIEALASSERTASPFNQGVRTSSPATSDGIGRSTQLLSSSEFQNSFCPSGYDFLYCWPDTGGNPWVQRTSWYLEGAMSATNCYTRFRYRYYDDGNWYTLVDRTASPGSYWYYYQYGSTRSRRFEVLNNDGCGVRFSVFGLL